MSCSWAHFLNTSRGLRSGCCSTKVLYCSGYPPYRKDRPHSFFIWWCPLHFLGLLSWLSDEPWRLWCDLKNPLKHCLSFLNSSVSEGSFSSSDFLTLRRLWSWLILGSQVSQRLNLGHLGHSYLNPVIGLILQAVHAMPLWRMSEATGMIGSSPLRMRSLMQGSKWLILWSTSLAISSLKMFPIS